MVGPRRVGRGRGWPFCATLPHTNNLGKELRNFIGTSTAKLLLSACTLAGNWGSAWAQSTEQAAMRECAVQADQGSLKGDARKAHMRECMPAARARLTQEQDALAASQRPNATPVQVQGWSSCDGTTMEMAACFEKELKAVEIELNRAYSRALKELSKPDEPLVPYAQTKRSLVEAQRAWVVFRARDCHAVRTLATNGSIASLEYMGCMRIHAMRRTEDLKAYFGQ